MYYTDGNLEVVTTTPIIFNPNQTIDSANFLYLSAEATSSKTISTNMNASLFNASIIISDVVHAPTGMRWSTDAFSYSHNYTAGEYSYDAVNQKLLLDVYNVKATNNLLVLDTIAPYFVTIPSDAHLSYPDTDFSAQFQGADTYQFNTYAVNDSLFSINSAGLLTPNNILQVGTYSINVSITDDYGNSASTTYKVYVGIQEDILALDIYPSITVTNGTQTTAQGSGCPAQLTCNLTRNGAAVTNPDIQTLAAGLYVYTYSTLGNVNYTARSISKSLTVTGLPTPTIITNLDKLNIGINYPQSLGNFKVSSNTRLSQTCDDGYNFCENCKITSISAPNNNTMLLSNVLMNWTGVEFEYVLKDNKVSETGEYLVKGYCTSGDRLAVWSYTFNISSLGKPLSLAQAVLYILMFMMSLIVFGIAIFVGFALPYENKRDAMTGYILAVENMKYVKIFSMAVSYLILMLMFYFGWTISYGYLDLGFLGNLFNIGFYVLLVALFPLFVIGVYLVIANWIRDSKVADALSGGLRIR